MPTVTMVAVAAVSVPDHDGVMVLVTLVHEAPTSELPPSKFCVPLPVAVVWITGLMATARPTTLTQTSNV